MDGMDDSTLSALRTAASAVFDVGFAAMVGALATPALLHDGASDWAARRARRCRGLFANAGFVALAASLAWIWLQTISLTELPPLRALAAVGGVVVDTAFGRAWAVATLALAAALVLAAAFRDRRLPRRTLALLLVAMAIARAGTGHAGANGFDWLVPATAMHLLATGLWAGGVFTAALVVLRGHPDAVDCTRYAARLSMLATVALAGVVLTGAAIAWHGLGGTLAPLVPADGSPWGIVLDVKLALVLLAVALGGVNRLVVMPSLPDSRARFARVLRVEAVVLLAALVAAAVLANGEPPAV